MAIIRNMSEAEYSAAPGIRHSTLKQMGLPTPRHAKWEIDQPPKEKECFLTGRSLHALVLENKRIFVAAPKADGRTNAGKEIKARFLAENADKIVLSADAAAAVEGMREGIMAHPGCRALVESLIEREVSIFWAGYKARLDGVFPGGVMDLKTTKGADPREFSKAIENFFYHTAAAHYSEGAAEVGFPCETFRFIAVENFPPFCAALYDLDDEAKEIGWRKLLKFREVYASCIASGIWPGYPDDPQTISLPEWAMKEGEK